MRLLFICALLVSVFSAPCFAQTQFPFTATVKSSGINIRSDSRVSSETICQVNKDECLEVIQELYGWYKVRLPKAAPSFIRKDLVGFSDIQAAANSSKNPAAAVSFPRKAKIIKERVNIRLHPNEGAPILGKLNKDAEVVVLGEETSWYKIEPVTESYGWIYKDFMEQGCKNPAALPKANQKKTR